MSETNNEDHHTEQILAALADSPPTQAQVSAARAMQAKFGFVKGDPVWHFLLVMGHYDRVLSELPAKLEQSAVTAAAILKAAADLQHTERKSQLAHAPTAPSNSSATLMASLRLDHLLLITASAIAMAVGFGAGHFSGTESMRGEAAWLKTPPGRAAFAFQQLNDIPAMLRCDKYERVPDGKRVWCRPQEQGKVYGWRIE